MKRFLSAGVIKVQKQIVRTVFDTERKLLFSDLEKTKIRSVNFNYCNCDHLKSLIQAKYKCRVFIISPEDDVSIYFHHSGKSNKICQQRNMLKAKLSDLENEVEAFNIFERIDEICDCCSDTNIKETKKIIMTTSKNCEKDDLTYFSSNAYCRLFRGKLSNNHLSS